MATENIKPTVEEKKVETPVEQPKEKVEAPKPTVDEDEEFINSLLEDVDTEEKEELTEEQKRQKNKDAEEARKRRAAEAKAKADAEAAKQAELQAKVTVTEEQKPKVEEKPVEKPQTDVNRLGEQLVDFKSKYPDVDLAQLDNDKTFKKFIDGKLLGKKDFTKLYEEYVELKAEITGTEIKAVQTNYQKAKSSSGSSVSPVSSSAEVFSEEELRRVAARLPTMNPREAAKIEEKLRKSIAYYDSKK